MQVLLYFQTSEQTNMFHKYGLKITLQEHFNPKPLEKKSAASNPCAFAKPLVLAYWYTNFCLQHTSWFFFHYCLIGI